MSRAGPSRLRVSAALQSGGASEQSSGRSTPLVDATQDGASSTAATSSGSSSSHPASAKSGGKPSPWRAASHIGSVVDDWPMYSSQSSDYIVGPPIGFGGSSVVYQASFLPLDGRACAVKVIDLEAFGRDLAEIRRETQLMSLSKHPNVLRVRGCWVEGSKLYIATRFMSSGSMLDIMRFSFPDGLEENVIATALKQALEGLNYLHVNGWLHRDLKAANMLVDEDGTVLLGDFGVGVYLNEGGKATTTNAASEAAVDPSKDKSKTRRDVEHTAAAAAAKEDASSHVDGPDQAARKSFVGTPCWMAPEVVERKGYGAKADIWSFGITALELASGHAPHSRLPPVKVLMRTLQDEPPTLDRTSGAYKYSKIFDDFIKQCLQKDPARRPSAEKLLGHAFFKQAKSRKHLVNTILAGLPPLSERQQRQRAMSIASIQNQLSWDFNTTVHGTGSRMTTPLHERVDPFHNFSGYVSSPRGSVRSSRNMGARENGTDQQAHQGMTREDGSISSLPGLQRKSRPPSGDYSIGGGQHTNVPPPLSGSWARRMSRNQRASVSFDIDETDEGIRSPGAEPDEADDALGSNSIGDLAGSGFLPPIEERRGARTSDGRTQNSNKDQSAATEPPSNASNSRTPPLMSDSGASSNAASVETDVSEDQTDKKREAPPCSSQSVSAPAPAPAPAPESKVSKSASNAPNTASSGGGVLSKLFKRT